ncbi:hypothetical protein QBC47DRAFT_384596 [Echria macrotheca]|uniref:Complex I intermediate-associated protein 84 n=1 Tax=Echria macrotheca TaxID=438768 RepID=A0AAJ0BDA7_9PEZI|nr:hypothetical protein QBC47DRAFT_384596 [Echria macrotheca]
MPFSGAMRSHLTRDVYRRLLASHGLVRPYPTSSVRCFSQQCRVRPLRQPLLRRPDRRTFFAELFQKPPREVKQPDFEPGYKDLFEFFVLKIDNLRLPDREALVKALDRFVAFKERHSRAVNLTQVVLLIRVLEHLLETAPEEGQTGGHVDSGCLEAILYILRWPPKSPDHHVRLARLVHKELESRRQALMEYVENDATSGQPELISPYTVHFYEVLTKYGGSVEAAEHFDQVREKLSIPGADDTITEVWTIILQGLAHEGRQDELLREYQKAMEAGLAYTPEIHEIMTTFFAKQNNVEETKKWFGKPIQGGHHLPTPATYLELARFSVRNGQAHWTRPIFEKLLRFHPEKAYWDVSFQWAVLAMDKGVEDVAKMIATMISGKDGQPGHEPDSATIDALLAAAIEKNNPYLAERFLSLGAKLRIEPQATTYLLQMNYRLDARDFAGAEAIWEKLNKGEIYIEGDEDLPVINKYLRLLCTVDKPDMDQILSIVGDLENRYAPLEAETIVALCMTFLRGDQQFDVIDTLSVHTANISQVEREKVLQSFVDYCLDKRTSTARAWDAYSLLRQFFGEMDYEPRVRLMDGFFARRRPDMACYVFGHMRGHTSPDVRPKAETYVRCLEGLGRLPDRESLKMVHNMLKMDTTVAMNTRLRNALMLAHAACDQIYTALEYWEQISGSTEGPTYNSLGILFYACERIDVRDDTAQVVWNKVKRMDLEIPPFVFDAYCGALAGQGLLADIQRLISGMEASLGYSPSMMTIGIVYNALVIPGLNEKFEEWAKREYPELWARLLAKGRRLTLDGPKFNIVRTFEA